MLRHLWIIRIRVTRGSILLQLAWIALGLFFASRLTGLQLSKYAELKFLSQIQQMATIDLGQTRRTIVDCHGNILAVDLPAYDLYVHPAMFPISNALMARILAPILDVSSEYLQRRFQEASTGICLMYQMGTTKSNQLRRLALDGIELTRHPQRIYPQRGSCANLLGYVDTEGHGQAGIESSLDSSLLYTNQDFPCWTDGHGNFLGRQFPRPVIFHEESVLQLTIDADLQNQIAQLLQEALQRFQAKRIAAIIMEAHTGAIRCLATAPSYDPNLYPWFPMERFRCWPMTDLFEPGSTFKPLNLAIALENGVLHPTERILDTGHMRIGEDWIRNVGDQKHLDHLTPTQILQRSSNVGMVRIMQAMDPEIYHRNLVRLGIGTPVLNNLALDSSASVVKERYEFVHHAIEPATAAFGQGLAMTPIKLVQLMASLANGGIAVTPHVVRGILPTHPPKIETEPQFQSLYFGHIPVPSVELGWMNAQTIPTYARQRRRLFSPQTCHMLLRMLEQVVLETGATGSRCFIPGYAIAGKTGTAQKPSPLGGYLQDAVVTSFVAMYPVLHPKFVTLVIIDEPASPFRFAFNTAADLTQAILSQLIIRERDAPQYPIVSVFERTV